MGLKPLFRRGTDRPGREGGSDQLVYRAQPVPYNWVPAGTPYGEHAVVPPDLTSSHLPPQR